MGLGIFEVHAGDFELGRDSQFIRGQFRMKLLGKFFRQKVKFNEIALLEIASEEAVISVTGAAGWGLGGAVLLGPVGLLAGLMLGGRSQETTFVCVFKDGRKFLATAKTRLFNDIQKQYMGARL